jgi:hypothetical protein
MNTKENILKRINDIEEKLKFDGYTEHDAIFGDIKALRKQVKLFAIPLVRHCTCSEDKKHGETSIMCCNECGLPTEENWV